MGPQNHHAARALCPRRVLGPRFGRVGSIRALWHHHASRAQSFGRNTCVAARPSGRARTQLLENQHRCAPIVVHVFLPLLYGCVVNNLCGVGYTRSNNVSNRERCHNMQRCRICQHVVSPDQCHLARFRCRGVCRSAQKKASFFCR